MKKVDFDFKKLRVLFIGSSISSKILLKKSVELKLNIVGVCTKSKSKNFISCYHSASVHNYLPFGIICFYLSMLHECIFFVTITFSRCTKFYSPAFYE